MQADKLRRLISEVSATSDGDYLLRLANGQRIALECADFIREHGPELLAIAEGAEADRADARRYRWLREDVAESAVPRVWESDDNANPTYCLHLTDLDAAIDAALAGAVTQGEGV